MQSNDRFEFGAKCLGAVGVTAAWRRGKNTTSLPIVVIQQASTIDDGVFQPASEVSVCGKDALMSLRAAIDEALRYVA